LGAFAVAVGLGLGAVGARPAVAQQELVDAIAVVVNGRPASWGRVFWEAAVFERYQSAPGHGPLLPYMAGHSVRDAMINRWLLLQEARGADTDADSRLELAAMVDLFRSTFATAEDHEAFLHRFGRKTRDLEDLFDEVVRADRHLRQSLKAQIHVPDRDVRRRYERLYGDSDDGPDYSEISGALRAQMISEEFRRQMESRVAILRNAAKPIEPPAPWGGGFLEPRLAEERATP
jgi:hypothetical protein